MSLERIKGWIMNWPRVRAAWNALVENKHAYVVETAPAAGIAVHHLVHATIYRAPVFEIAPSKKPKYFTAKKVYVPGIVRDTIYVVPEADSAEAAQVIVSARAGFRKNWTEVIRDEKVLREGVVARRGDVVEYVEALN